MSDHMEDLESTFAGQPWWLQGEDLIPVPGLRSPRIVTHGDLPHPENWEIGLNLASPAGQFGNAPAKPFPVPLDEIQATEFNCGTSSLSIQGSAVPSIYRNRQDTASCATNVTQQSQLALDSPHGVFSSFPAHLEWNDVLGSGIFNDVSTQGVFPLQHEDGSMLNIEGSTTLSTAPNLEDTFAASQFPDQAGCNLGFDRNLVPQLNAFNETLYAPPEHLQYPASQPIGLGFPEATYSTDLPRAFDLSFNQLPAQLGRQALQLANLAGSSMNPSPQPSPPVQSAPRPYTCMVPGCHSRGFKRIYELQRHMRKHSRQQLFPCPVAGCHFQDPANAFYRRDKLQSHMRLGHSGYQAGQ